jgi:predicted ribosome quality control (RQC) complex YloA/Tae2 family protein
MEQEPRPMGNLDYHYLAPELNQALGGAWLNQAYDWIGGFRLKLHKEGEVNLTVQPGMRLHLTTSVTAAPPTQTSFTKFLRKNLDNARVQSVEQLCFDRIVRINLPQKREGAVCALIFEQFGQGNVLALDANKCIIRPMTGKDYAQRSLHKGLAYEPPGNTKPHPSECTAEGLSTGAKKEQSIVAAVASAVNLPPFYIEEACARCGLALQLKAGELKTSDWSALSKEIRALPTQEKSPRTYYLNQVPYAYSPFPLKKLDGVEGLQEVPYPSFSEALDAYYSPFWKQQLQVEAQTGASKETEKVKWTLEQQERARLSFAQQAVEYRLAGEWVYANLQAVDEILQEARELRKKELDPQAIAKELNGKAAPLGMNIGVSPDRLTLKLERKTVA